MPSLKSRIPLIAIIILTGVVLFFTLRDILYEKQLLQLLDFISEKQMLQRIIILYVILIIFVIVLTSSRITKKFETVLRSRRIFEVLLKDKLHHFKCPNCNEIFTIKKSKINEDKSFVITCPCCGSTGRIPSMPKSVEAKFECINCGEQVSIWADEAKSSHKVVVYSCPYCGKKQSMKNI